MWLTLRTGMGNMVGWVDSDSGHAVRRFNAATRPGRSLFKFEGRRPDIVCEAVEPVLYLGIP